jgi:hypothetical protein
MSDENLNERAARKLAQRKDFKGELILYCTECGRTVLRTQKIGNSGYKDSVYCTCKDIGPPMVELEPDND